MWFQAHHQGLWRSPSTNYFFAQITIARCAKLRVAGAWLIFGGGENNICHGVYAYKMLASDVCYRARVCGGPWLGHDSMCVHPWWGNANYDKARYNSWIARDNMMRWNITRHRLCHFLVNKKGVNWWVTTSTSIKYNTVIGICTRYNDSTEWRRQPYP